MSTSWEPLKNGIRAFASEARRNLGEHPSPEELIAYQAYELTGTESQRIREHLGICPECVNAVLDLEAFPAVERREPEAGATPEESAKMWNAIEAGLAAGAEPADDSAKSAPRESSSGWKWAARILGAPAWVPRLAVAMLLVALIGWNFHLRNQIDRLSHIHPHVVVSDLLPVTEGELRSGRPRTVRLASELDGLVLVLDVADTRGFSNFRIEVKDGGGSTLDSILELTPTPDGLFLLEIPRAAQYLGELQLVLFGESRGNMEVLAVYRLYVELRGDH